MPRDTLPFALLAGLRDCAPFNLVVVPFAVLFGVLTSEAGWGLWQAVGMSVGVLAGASQFAAVQLVHEGTPALVIVLTGLAVNLRMAMYSASLAPHFGPLPLWQRALAAYALNDETFGVTMNHLTGRPRLTLREKFGYFAGAALAICPAWCLFTAAGVAMGRSIPEAFALDFAPAIAFIALFAPALRSLPHLAAALVAAGAALALVWLPLNLWIIAAGALGMAAGAAAELALARRRP